MIIQKINHAPNFSAKTGFADWSVGGGEEPKLSRKVREILADEPDLEEGRIFMVTRQASNDYDSLLLSITDLQGYNQSSRAATIYDCEKNNGQVTKNYGELEGKGIHFRTKLQILARQLVESAAENKIKEIMQLREAAQKLRYSLVKTVS